MASISCPAPAARAAWTLERTPAVVWGVPLVPLTLAETLAEVERRVQARRPSFFVTANLNWAMLAARDERLQAVHRKAAFIVADGMPFLWGAWRKGRPLPERVTGSDLVPALCARCAARGFRVLLLGGAPGAAAEAARRLRADSPGLVVLAEEAPLFRGLGPEQNESLVRLVRRHRPDVLLVACSQPDGELWLADNCERLGVPVAIQVGAALDFVAGRVPRAPRWMQRAGLEWLYRLWRDPRRLAPRYGRNARFLLTTPA